MRHVARDQDPRLVEELPDRERNALLEALPSILDDVRRGAAEQEAASERTPESTTPTEPALVYAPPESGDDPAPYLIEADDRMAAAFDDVRVGDRLLVDPSVGPRPGDLIVMRGEGRPVLRRLEHDGTGYRLMGDDRGGGYEHLEPEALEQRVRRFGAGTVLEVRRPLRRR